MPRQERLIGAICASACTISPGRREDRLVFDLQTALAEQLGLVDTPTRRASEQLMQRYYRAAKLVRQVNIDPAAEPARAAVPGCHATPVADRRASSSRVDELLDVRDEALFERGPRRCSTPSSRCSSTAS